MKSKKDAIVCCLMWILTSFIILYVATITNSAWCLWAFLFPTVATSYIINPNANRSDENEHGENNKENERRWF